MISIVNWDTYQQRETESDKESDKQVTKTRQRGDKEVTTNKNEKKNKEVYRWVFVFWNSQKIVIHKQVEKFKPSIKAALLHYTVGEIKEAVFNYAKVLKEDDYFFSYRWGLDEFLGRKNGLV